MDDADGPFFLALNYMDAHDPYYVERGCGEPDGYAAALRCLDRSLPPIVDWQSSRRPTVLADGGAARTDTRPISIAALPPPRRSDERTAA